MAVCSTDYPRRLRSAIKQSAGTFEVWMQIQHDSTHMESCALVPTVWARDGQDSAIIEGLELDFAEAAGLAACAVRLSRRPC